MGSRVSKYPKPLALQAVEIRAAKPPWANTQPPSPITACIIWRVIAVSGIGTSLDRAAASLRSMSLRMRRVVIVGLS
jgi:hypothetical protein